MQQQAMHCVGPPGEGILDDVLALLLHNTIIGDSSTVAVLTLSESILMTNVDLQLIPFSLRFPAIHHLLLPQGIEQTHYILYYVHIPTRTIQLYDSLADDMRAALLFSKGDVLVRNVWGLDDLNTVKLALAPGPQQQPGSNDCGIFCFRNILMILSEIHPVPVLMGVTLTDGSEIDRNCVREIFDTVYPGLGYTFSLAKTLL